MDRQVPGSSLDSRVTAFTAQEVPTYLKLFQRVYVYK